MGPALLDLAHTQELLGGLSRVTLWRLDRTGELRAVRIGTRRFWRRADVERFVETLEPAHTGRSDTASAEPEA